MAGGWDSGVTYKKPTPVNKQIAPMAKIRLVCDKAFRLRALGFFVSCCFEIEAHQLPTEM